MTPTESTLVIAAAGGDTAFGGLLGIDRTPGFQQRINNWKRRGIPSAVVVEHFDTIQQLRTKAATTAATAQSAVREQPGL
jgi:hypothetical protein